MNERMNEPVVKSLAHVTWGIFWEAYAGENNSVQNALNTTGIYIEPAVLAEIESSARNLGEPGSNAYKDHFMDAVAKLKSGQIASQTSYETAAATSKPVVFPVDTFLDKKTQANIKDVANFGFDIPSYEHSTYLQAEAAKEVDVTIRTTTTVENYLDSLRNEFIDRSVGATIALKRKQPEKNIERNYKDILAYAEALNNIVKAAAEKTGAPEWIPVPELLAPIQWMMQQRSEEKLTTLYNELAQHFNNPDVAVIAEMEQRSQVPEVKNDFVPLKELLRQEIIPGDNMTTWEHYWNAYNEARESLPEAIRSEGDRVMNFEAHKMACAVLSIDIKNLEDNERTVFMGSKSPEEYQRNFMVAMAEKIRPEAVAKAEQARKREFQVMELKTELAKMNNTDYKDIYDPKVKEMTMSFVGKNSHDPLVVEFGNKYMEVVALFQKIANKAEPDSVAKADFIAKLLLENDGEGLKAIAAFSVLKDEVAKKYDFLTQVPNPKNDAKVSAKNNDITSLDFSLIKPFQWLGKYEGHFTSLEKQGEPVSDLVRIFHDIGQAANKHKLDVDKRIQFLAKVEGLQELKSGMFTGELNKLKAELRLLSTSHESLAESVEALIGLYVKALDGNASDKDKVIIAKNISVLSGFRNEMDVPRKETGSPSNSDTESMDSESSATLSAPASPRISPRVPVEEKPAILPAQQMQDFYAQYNKVRAEYMKGKLDEAVKLFVALCEDIQKNNPYVKPGQAVSGDDLQRVMIEILAKSNPGLADVAMAKKLSEYTDNNKEKLPAGSSYYVDVMMNNQINKLVIHDLFKNNSDPFTLSTQNGPLKVRAAYKTMANFNAGDITEAILAEPSLADAFLKRRYGTKITGINFRELLAQDPDSIRRLMVSKDPVILRAIETSQLLETSHLTEEARAELKGPPPERADDIEMEHIDPNVHAEDIAYCVEQLQEIEHPKLRDLLLEKFESAVDKGLDRDILDARQIEKFVHAINTSIKNGMSYAQYDKILKDFGGEPPSMNALFNLESKDFPKGNGFRALPPAPAVAPKAPDPKASDVPHGLHK